MPEQVEAEDPVPALGERLGQRSVDAAGEEQRRQEQHDLVARPVLVVDQPVPVVAETAVSGP